jgi:ribonuclease HI
MIKWAVELGQFDVTYEPRTAIKGQVLADFIVEFSPQIELRTTDPETWSLYVDGSATNGRAGAGIVLKGPNNQMFCSAVRFTFTITNNEAEYEAFLAGLEKAKAMGIRKLRIHTDSQVIAHQISGKYEAKESRMASYLCLARLKLTDFSYEILNIPRGENAMADALAKIASSREAQDLETVTISNHSVTALNAAESNDVFQIETTTSAEVTAWTHPIQQYLLQGTLPLDQIKAQSLRTRAARYTMVGGILYKRGFSLPLLRCLDEREAANALQEIHEGTCSSHGGAQSLAHKLIRQGYYWPTLKKDASDMVKKCLQCQIFSPAIRTPPEKLASIFSPCPFAKWGIDLIGPLPTGKGGVQYAIVAVDYFTKWAEAETLAKATDYQVINFVWKNVICRFGTPIAIVSDNGPQFNSTRFRSFCTELRIKNEFSTPYHPQSNGQVEAVNKILKDILKKKIHDLKASWSDELPSTLWSYRTTYRSATGDTPFSLAFGSDALIPIELEIPTYRVANYDENENEQACRTTLDLLEERREMAATKNAIYKQRSEKYYNKKVRPRRFQPNDLVIKQFQTKQKSLQPKWEGPYRIRRVLRHGAYELETMDGAPMEYPQNAVFLKKYFQ